MFETLFGSEIPLAARFFIAFLVVLALIGLTAWLVRRFGANRIGGATRGRQPRLAVVDAASVDGRRRLILIRRDNIEHLLMIGGPTDVVVEQNIVRAGASRELGRDGARSAAGDTLPRAVPLADAGAWPLQPEPAPVQNTIQSSMQPSAQTSAQAPRAYRAAVTDEPWVAPDPTPRARAPEPPPASPEFSARPASDFAPASRAAPQVNPPVAREPTAESSSAPALPPQTDRNLAEMAQRLEAALRHPGHSEPHPPVSDPLAAAAAARPSERPPERPPEPPRVATAAREIRSEVRSDVKSEVRPAVRAEQKSAAPAKSAYDNLEQEMANLLGRPSGKM